jgi:uncharacterized membrane protein
MTPYTDPYAGQPPQPSPFARWMAFLGYALLLLAPPTLGTAAVLALILAYARRDGALPLIRSHHQFQIRIFWISLALFVASGAFFLAALFATLSAPPPVMRIPRSVHAQTIAWRPQAVQGFSYGFRSQGGRWSRRARLEGGVAAVLFGSAVLWTFGAPLWGASRLASGRPMGHSRP